MDHLFPSVSLRDKINEFIDNCLLNNNDIPDTEAISNGFVFVQRFPKFNEKTIDKYSDLMHMGLVNTLNQCKKIRQKIIFYFLIFLVNQNNSRKLICCIWTLCCMIEADRISLGGKTKR
jgi:hypothetical protein